MSARIKRKSRGIDSNTLEATPEDLRIEIDQVFKAFLADPGTTEFVFTSELTKLQRKYIHNKAQKLNIVSKSSGKEPNRTLHLKKRYSAKHCKAITIDVSDHSKQAIHQLTINSIHQDIELLASVSKRPYRNSVFTHVPLVPPPIYNYNIFHDHRQYLPIFYRRDEVLKCIDRNCLTVISAETGSGKTTQVPQYILEECAIKNEKCRIICTQPRRIAAVAAAERVAAERDEKLGNTVGYIVRLEQMSSEKSNLIFCTTGVFLRQLMTSPNALKNITHIIIDEIHERGKDTDFILTCLKILLSKYPRLKLIFMSATLNAEFFIKYFGAGEMLSVAGRQYDIRLLYLPEILARLNFMSSKMSKLKLTEDKTVTMKKIAHPDICTDPPSQEEVDKILDYYRDENNEEYDTVEQFKYFVGTENLPVDIPHSETGQTALMLAAKRLDMEFIDFLLEEGADLENTCFEGMCALDYAPADEDKEILLAAKARILRRKEDMEFRKNVSNLHQLYDKTFTEDIDYELIAAIVKDIMLNCTHNGAILIFLPGYENLMICNDYIIGELPDQQKYKLFLLHSSINIKQQSDVFKKLTNCRKIILATNIAETSITIDDAMYVIDTGKVKEKSFDYLVNASCLRTVWVSQASAEQRKGRAGRTGPGTCFRMYTKTRFEAMEMEKPPEMLTVSLEELCLHTKIVAPVDKGIPDFLQMAPSPPLRNRIDVAIGNLVVLGALDEDENLTTLGKYLSDIPLEPHFGKMIISAIILKCLDPILTLTAAMSNQDPYDLPQKQKLKAVAEEKRMKLIDGIHSDHFAYLNAFTAWEKSGRSEKFCNENFINKNAMSAIVAMRRLLVKQLLRMGFISNENDLPNFNINSGSWPVVKAALSTGLFPNVAIMRHPSWFIKDTHKVSLSRSSACNTCPSGALLIYDEVFSYNNLVLKGVTAVTPVTIALVCGSAVELGDSLQISWINFKCWSQEFLQFRELFENLAKKILNCPQYTNYDERDTLILSTIRNVLNKEESLVYLKTPLVMPLTSNLSGPHHTNWRTRRGGGDRTSHRGGRQKYETEHSVKPNYKTERGGGEPNWRSEPRIGEQPPTSHPIRRQFPHVPSSRGDSSYAPASSGHHSPRSNHSDASSSRGNHSNTESSRGGAQMPRGQNSYRGGYSRANSRGKRSGRNRGRGANGI